MAVKRTRKPATARRSSIARARSRRRKPSTPSEVREIESLRAQLDRLAAARAPRWNANPDDVRKSVLKLLSTLVAFNRQILEPQAIRRLAANTLTPEQPEAVGLPLQRLEATI